ncbi:flp pilus assembly membrane protein tadE [Vibrio ishigakensis]|uniref:Flp pilus assembly membrane protein tadE n=1 Tax=Vibrio ishigakensis TaxID=1481914 RepID=A0A0B8QE05_9VIBR|nr:flp pilus assembly membrane protein tadE [Vibrio ishigakensis]
MLSVEFGLGAFALFLTLFAVFEVGRFSYLVNMTDATLSESTRKVRIFEGEKLETSYLKRLEEVFEDDDSLWNQIGLVSAEDFYFQIETYASPQALTNGNQTANCERCPLVVYQLNYDYSPIMFPSLLSSATISRRILTIQEHEGWEDEDA